MRLGSLRPAFGALLALALALTSGCGDGDDRLSRADFLRQADAICVEYDEELRSIERELRRSASPEDAARAVDRGIPIVEEGLAELRRLEPPEELEEDAERWLELKEESVATLEALRDAARKGDTQRVAEIAAEGAEAERRSDELARAIGLDACAADA